MKQFGLKTLGAALVVALLAGLAAFQADEVFATALTANRNTELKFGVDIKAYPVAATTDIFGGSLVCLTTAGYATPCTDTASYIAVGIAEGRADNNPGAAGAINVRVRAGIAKMNATSITQAMVGLMMYVVDDNVVDDSVGTNGISVGPLLEYVSSTSGWVWVGPQQQPNIKVTPDKLMAGVGAGYRIARGTVSLDGSNPTEVSHGLTTAVACQLTDVRPTAPGLDPVHFTYTIVSGTLNIYAWQHTHSSNPTLIASTDADDVIAWSCVGT